MTALLMIYGLIIIESDMILPWLLRKAPCMALMLWSLLNMSISFVNIPCKTLIWWVLSTCECRCLSIG